MLLARMPGALHLGPYHTIGCLHRHFSNWNQCCGWITPCGSYDCKMQLSSKHQGTLKKQDLLLMGPGGYTAHPGPHRLQVERVSMETWGPAIIGDEGKALRVLWIHCWQI